MKPYPEKGLDDRKGIFNDHLSRLRRVRENGFGIWVNRFRIFHTNIDLDPDAQISGAQSSGNNVTTDAVVVRENFADYFAGPGQVDWQWKVFF